MNTTPRPTTPHPRRYWRYVPATSSWTIGQMVEVSADVVARDAVEGRGNA